MTGRRPEGSGEAVAYDLGLSFASRVPAPYGEKAQSDEVLAS